MGGKNENDVLCLEGTTLKVGDFVWAENEGPSPCSDGEVLPDLDLSLSDEELIPLLHSAAASWGFFRIFNHGIPDTLFNSISAHALRFFDLPFADKLAVARKTPASLMGYIGIACSATYKAWCEALHLMPGEDHICGFLDGVPSLPDRASFGADVIEYFSEVGALARRLIHLLFRGLDLDEAEAKVVCDNMNCATMRINNYPACPIPNLTYGSPPHKDYGGISILHQDDIGGLEILKDGGWVPVKPEKGYLVVNVGDLIQILSNGAYKSVLHRSLVHNSQQRLSLAFFSFPQEESVIAPVSKLVTKYSPPKYKCFYMREYRSMFPKAQTSKNHSPAQFFEIQQNYVPA